jgi:FkbM family methyltransferase
MEKSVGKIADIVDRLIGSKKISTVVEIGAKDCTETIGLSERFPAAHIYTFECNPATLPLCRARVAGNTSITLTEKAVSDKDGTVTFFPIDPEKTRSPWADGNQGASSLLRASGKYPKETYVQREITVPSTTLLSFIDAQGIAEIGLLWMDIQGAELMALKSAGKKLSTIKVIHLEVEFMEIYSGQPLMADIKRYLNRNGFSLYGFTNFGRYSGDAVFVNDSVFGGRALFRNAFIWQWYRWVWGYVSYFGRLMRRIFAAHKKASVDGSAN